MEVLHQGVSQRDCVSCIQRNDSVGSNLMRIGEHCRHICNRSFRQLDCILMRIKAIYYVLAEVRCEIKRVWTAPGS
jgi:hypothetical protein